MYKKSHILKGTFFCMIIHSNFWKTRVLKLKTNIYLPGHYTDNTKTYHISGILFKY